MALQPLAIIPAPPLQGHILCLSFFSLPFCVVNGVEASLSDNGGKAANRIINADLGHYQLGSFLCASVFLW